MTLLLQSQPFHSMLRLVKLPLQFSVILPSLHPLFLVGVQTPHLRICLVGLQTILLSSLLDHCLDPRTHLGDQYLEKLLNLQLPCLVNLPRLLLVFLESLIQPTPLYLVNRQTLPPRIFLGNQQNLPQFLAAPQIRPNQHLDQQFSELPPVRPQYLEVPTHQQLAVVYSGKQLKAKLTPHQVLCLVLAQKQLHLTSHLWLTKVGPGLTQLGRGSSLQEVGPHSLESR